MSTSFEQIKDTSQLQEYLLKHAATGSTASQAAKNKTGVRPIEASPAANDYVGRGQLRGGATNVAFKRSNAASPTNAISDRYDRANIKKSHRADIAEA